MDDLKGRRDLHEGRITDDDVKARLAELLEGKVGPKYPVEKLNALVIEGDIRYSIFAKNTTRIRR